MARISRDKLLELAAIFYLGCDLGESTLEEGLRRAQGIVPAHLAQHIAEKGNIALMIPLGLKKLGLQL